MKKAFKIGAILLALVVVASLAVVFGVNAADTELNSSNYLTAMETSGSYKLTEDVGGSGISAAIRIGENVTLDLNGHTITTDFANGVFYQLAVNPGTFVITDSVGGGAIIAPNSPLLENVSGTVRIEGGSIIASKISDNLANVTVTIKGSDTVDTKGTWTSFDPNANCVDGYIGIDSTDANFVESAHTDAVYRVVPKDYTITYIVPNGAVHSNVGVYDIETPDITLTPATCTGYSFVGWYLKDNNGESAKISTISTSTRRYDLIIEGVFELADYVINYNLPTAAVNAEANPETFTVQTADITLADPSLKGATFKGWYSDAACTVGNEVTKIECSTTPNDVNVYPKFEYVTYTITYHKGEGTFTPTITTYQVIDNVALETPTLTGYTFTGWYTAEEGGEKISAIEPGMTGNLELWARYEIINYEITYDFDGVEVSNVDELPTTYTVESDTITLVAPEVPDGITFTAWVDEATGNPVTEIATGSTGNLVLVLSSQKTQYKLFYHFGDGIDPSNINNTANPVEYFDVTEEVILNAPERAYYVFEGWYDSNTADAKKIDKIEKGTTKNVTVYARWTPKNYSITYDQYGFDKNLSSGLFDTRVDKDTVTVTFDATTVATYNVETSVTLPTPVRTGYKFVGWYDAVSDSVITEIKAGTRNGDVSLVARWELATFKVNVLYKYTDEYAAANNISDADAILFSTTADVYFGGAYTHNVEFYDAKYNGFVPDHWVVSIEEMPAEDTDLIIYFSPVVLSTVYENGKVVITYADNTKKEVAINSVAGIALEGGALVYTTADGNKVTVASVATTADTAALKTEIDNLNKALTDLKTAVEAKDAELVADISANATAIAANASSITKNAAAITALEATVADLTSRVEALETQIADLDGTSSTLLVLVIVIAVVVVGLGAAVVVLFVKKK